MSKRAKPPHRSRGNKAQSASFAAVERALLARVDQRSAASGLIKLPAVPALVEFYLELCAAIFNATGRGFTDHERLQARDVLAQRLDQAFSESPRSKIIIKFQAEAGRTLGYEVQAEISSIADAYERWIGTSDKPLFGTHPDARVWALAKQMQVPASSPILDLGAGTGRNAFALARRGHPVDALEITPKFAELISAAAHAEALPVNVIVCNAFRDRSMLRHDYAMLFASEVVPDFRGSEDLLSLFELAAEVLAEGGLLVFNVHMTALGYTPERAVREFAQQCYSALYTPHEVAMAAASTPFELISNESVHDFERAHLPPEAWPPTPWFINWAMGVDVLEMERDKCPIELRWLVFRKRSPGSAGADATANPSKARPIELEQLSISLTKSQRTDAQRVRRALLLRLSRRWLGSGSFAFPAVPGLREHFIAKCLAMFEAFGRHWDIDQANLMRQSFDRVLCEAFASSPRSNMIVNYDAAMGTELRYSVTADAVPLTTMYEDWLERLPPPLFGELPDARLLELLDEIGDPAHCRVCDLGAGTGRNALYLAEQKYDVVAVDCVPTFARLMLEAARSKNLNLHIVEGDFFQMAPTEPYTFCIASGVIGDLRDTQQLRQFFHLVASSLAHGGWLLLSAHIAADSYRPDATARQWAQQCCATFFTPSELDACTVGLGLELVSNEAALEFESTHLPAYAFPPTPAYTEWATCTHMLALPAEQSPIGLRWLVYRKGTR